MEYVPRLRASLFMCTIQWLDSPPSGGVYVPARPMKCMTRLFRPACEGTSWGLQHRRSGVNDFGVMTRMHLRVCGGQCARADRQGPGDRATARVYGRLPERALCADDRGRSRYRQDGAV